MFQMETTKTLHILLCFFHLASGLISAAGERSSIGVCYGMKGDNLPSPKEVVSMYKSYGIGRMRLYEPNAEVLECLRGSSIGVVVGIRNADIEQLTSFRAAEHWIERHIKPYKHDVHFRYIVVGHNAIPGPNSLYVLNATKSLHAAISNDHLLHHIKVSTAISDSILGHFHSPSSNASFRGWKSIYMRNIARYLSITGAPLLANLRPTSSFVTQAKVNGTIRTPEQLLEEQIDGLRTALRKIGAPGIQIVVSEVGWPWFENDSKEYAESFLSYAIQRARTPHQPRGPVGNETYLYAMFDENRKHPRAGIAKWGLFSSDKKLNVNISFT